jgi:acyl carrier protein
MHEFPQESERQFVRRAQLPLSVPYLAPRTPTEDRLAQIWQSVLSMDMVGVEDEYYDLGGDSFLAAIIFGMIEETFSITIPLAVLVEAPSIAKLAPKVDGLIRAKSASGHS